MQDWKKMGRDLVGEVVPRIVDAATAYGQSNGARELAHVNDGLDARWQRIEGDLVDAQAAWEFAHMRLVAARAQVSRCEQDAYEAKQRGSHDLAIDFLEERQQANAVVDEYERILPELESNLDRLTEDRRVFESEYRKLREKALALRLRQGSARALSEMGDALERLQFESAKLQGERELVDQDVAEARARLKGARQSPHLRRGYLARADLENQLKELMRRKNPDIP